jgi:hypothetical protein
MHTHFALSCLSVLTVSIGVVVVSVNTVVVKRVIKFGFGVKI